MSTEPSDGVGAADGHDGAGPHDQRTWLTTGVASVGATSFFSDSGHEVATAVLPSFVTSTLHASAGALGLIEGISDGLKGVATLIGGPLSNDQRARGRLASGGYVGTAFATGAIGVAATVWQVGVLRTVAWVSRGLRSPARDTLLASLAPERAYGRAFGLERAGDNLGAVVGPLAAAGLVASLGIRPTLYLAAVPGLIAAVTITVAAREARHHGMSMPGRIRLELSGLRQAGLVRPLLPIAMFELGNVTTTLLILRATQLLQHGGRSLTAATSAAILIYAAHNAFASVVSAAGGHWIDRMGPRVVFGAGAVLYIAAYGGFAVSWGSWPPILLAFILAGSGIGLAETAESTLVARLLPDHLRGSGFGILGGIQSFGDFASSAVVGVLYAAVSPTAGFAYAATWMLMSTATSLYGTSMRPAGEGQA